MDQLVNGIDWLNISADDLRRGADDSKSKLPSLFERKWLEVMGDVIPCINCKGIGKKLNLMKQNIVKMSENKSQFKLKGKYNGIYGYTNADMTDKKAEELAKKHPRGYDLFELLPPEIQKRLDDLVEKDKAEIRERAEQVSREAEAAHQVAGKKVKDAEDVRNKKAILVKQREAEAIKKTQKDEEKNGKRARHVELLGKHIEWLKRKAKKLKLSTQGDQKALANRIYNKEFKITK